MVSQARARPGRRTTDGQNHEEGVRVDGCTAVAVPALLTELAADGVTTLSSEELARRCGTIGGAGAQGPVVLRHVRQAGLGYSVPELVRRCVGSWGWSGGGGWRWSERARSVRRCWATRISGEQGFDIEAVFDTDPRKWGGVERPDGAVGCGAGRALREGIDIVIVAVPAEAAQAVVDRVVAAGCGRS
jgi:NADH/NAD ratio-sensing transcriptional regulator Rex